MQTVGLKRNTIDKYYTKPDIVQQCIQALKEQHLIKHDDLIIEPSAGNGSFINAIKSLSTHHVFYDLEPEHPEIIRQDFLDLTPPVNYNKIHIIGNPPFGRQSSLAIQFIRKSCTFCDSLSFILPKSFKKDSMKSKIPLDYHLICELDLGKNAFLVDNIEYDVPCVFQIWVKKSEKRLVCDKLEPKGFVFVDKTNNPDISFRRVGVNAGTIDTHIENKSEQSHYFIQFNNGKNIRHNLHSLEKLAFEFNNTVGPKSISKQELISQFNLLL
jgi:predicted RNA methylase